MVYTERVDVAAVSRGTSHVTTKQPCKYTTSVDVKNQHAVKLNGLGRAPFLFHHCQLPRDLLLTALGYDLSLFCVAHE